MLYKYSDFIIKEGSQSRPSPIYWYNQLEKILKNNWTEISINKNFVGRRDEGNKYTLNFKIDGNSSYDYYLVLIDENKFYMEDTCIPKFKEKFKTEFWKNAPEYVKNVNYSPDWLGDIEHVKDANKYNM